MKIINKLSIMILSIVIIMGFTGCKPKLIDVPTNDTGNTQVSETAADKAKEISIKDREGNNIVIPNNVDKIISLAPSTTQILIDLGLEDKLTAVDKESKKLLGDSNTLPEFDIMNPDAEQLANLTVDIIFATGMSKSKGDDPLKLLKDMGATVTYIPTSATIADIKEDIMFISEITNTQIKGQALIDAMEKEIKKYADIGETITNKKTVYFEISAAPNMYSFGKDVFLHEVIELIGAKNIFEKESGWILITPEAVVSANPDIILTNVNYIENPIEEIKSRTGFSEINAVKDNHVYAIDNNSSSNINHKIVDTIKEIAEAVYPEEYKNK